MMTLLCHQSLARLVLAAALILFPGGFRGGVWAWKYTYSSNLNLQWHEARQWCQNHLANMVSTKSQEEVEFLNALVPFNPTHYWIAVRKIAGKWTWVETNQPVPGAAQIWAPEEPDSIPHQDCVEIYIKRGAKWNNEKCSRQKGVICYKDSCTRQSCSGNGDCIETLGGFTCNCHLGFNGLLCADAIPCKPFPESREGSYRCSHPNGVHRFNSSCQFSCDIGFQAVGVSKLLCQANGHWNHPAPWCEVKHCPVLDHNDFRRGTFICQHPIGNFSYNSSCEFTCDEGHKLVGQSEIKCDHNGQWTATLPTCTALRCKTIHVTPSRMLMNCSHPLGYYSFGSECHFSCKGGFSLNGSTAVFCSSSGIWSDQIPTCTGSSLAIRVLQCAAFGATCAALIPALMGVTVLMKRCFRKGEHSQQSNRFRMNTFNSRVDVQVI